MTPADLEIDPRAAAEARAVLRWYSRRSRSAAERFIAELDRALEKIAAGPKQWPAYLHETRVFRLRRFPYLVVYYEWLGAVVIVAVAHANRRPGYWKTRLS